MKSFILLSLIFLLTACQTTMIKSDDSYLTTSSQATIEITQQLTVPPNSARAYFQHGELLRHTGIDFYAVDCEIEINTVSESRQAIEPGLFNVISIVQDESPIVMTMPVMVASLNFARGGGDGGGPVEIKKFYRFRLSAQDPEAETQVRSMTCRGAQDDPYKAELPTYSEMQAAVGQYVILNLF